MLYFIKSQNYVKIGYSQSFETLVDRMESYITHNPNLVLISFTEYGTKENEKSIHLLLKDYQYFSEWFKNDIFVFNTWDEYINKNNLIPKNCYFQLPEEISKLRKLDYRQTWDSNPILLDDDSIYSSKENIEILLLKYLGTFKTFNSEDFIRACNFCSREIGVKVNKKLLEDYGYIFNEFTDVFVTIKKIKFVNIKLQNN